MKISENPILLILATVVIFLVGAAMGGMYVKIQYLEGKGGVIPTTQALGAAGVQNQAAPGNTGGTQNPPSAPTPPTKIDVKVTAADPMLGDPKAKVTVVEFADYQCPFCERFFTDAEAQIKKDYVDTGKVKFVFKNLAFLGKESTDAANAAECAKEQNKFWEYHDYLYTHQGQENSGAFAPDKLKGFAATLGLNTDQFNSCLDTQKYNATVQADQAEANRVGFNSTPSVAVGSTPIIGAQPYAQFKTAIEAALAAAK